MKALSCIIAAIVGLFTVSLQAGQAVVSDKNVVPAPPPPVYGTGPYLAIDAGANAYQDRGGDRTFTDQFGDTLTFSPKNDVGFFGGIKAGWVFGTGVFRPTIEGDFFYNGFRGGADGTVTLADGEVVRGSTGTSYINTGAFMSNFIARFAFDRFQPYFGAGVGVYYAESAGTDIKTPRGTFSNGGGASHTDLAWQVIAGADYYWSPKISTFLEYHYLDYTSSQIDTSESRDLGQHLVGAGMRFHF
jgi:opacity protein-like surface antigen